MVLGTRPEQCTGSCMVELAIQLTDHDWKPAAQQCHGVCEALDVVYVEQIQCRKEKQKYDIL